MKNNKENISPLLVRARFYGILEPEKLVKKILARDKTCIYCHKKMKRYLHTIGTPGDKITIEHLNYKATHGETKDIGLCCGSCNSSRSDQKLSDWFKTSYCKNKKREINKNTVAKPVKEYIKRNPKK